MRKIWLKPKLVMLIKGRPEEHILGCCKGEGAEGPTGNEGSCRYDLQLCDDCVEFLCS